ncbi:RluA family pseudouridine synthase [Sporosarcina sp. CAU 1771]
MTAFVYTIQEGGQTVEHLLRDQWQAGKKTVHLMRMAKSVTDRNGEPVIWKEPLDVGTELTISFPDAESTYALEKQTDLKVIFEDDHMLAVYKPAGITTHPDKPGQVGTLMNQVMTYVTDQGGVYAEHVHRLDKGTAGVLLVAKHPIAKALLDRKFEQNEITRKYIAETDGLLKRPKGTIKLPIGKDRHNSAKRRVSLDGQSAVTHFRVIERTEDSSVIEAELETGRTHQIRVHLAHIGHPVKGDTLYEGSKTDDGQYKLTASELAFVHPITNEEMTISLNYV